GVSAQPAPAAAPAPNTAPPRHIDPPAMLDQTIAVVAKQIESYLRSNGRSLEFYVDQSTHRTVVTVRDAATGEIVRQIPPEEAQRLAQSLNTQQPSALVDLLA